MKHIIALAALLLVGCQESGRRYLITYEATTKLGEKIRFTIVQDIPHLNEKHLNVIKDRVFENPMLNTNHLVVLAVVKLEDE